MTLLHYYLMDQASNDASCVCVTKITVCVLGHCLSKVVWEPNLHSAHSQQMEMLLSPNTRPVQKPTGEVGQTHTHTYMNIYTHRKALFQNLVRLHFNASIGILPIWRLFIIIPSMITSFGQCCEIVISIKIGNIGKIVCFCC